MLEHYDDAWRRRCISSPFRDMVTFFGEDLVLGQDTILCKLGPKRSADISLRSDAEHDRMVALLAVAGRGCLAKTALSQLDAAVNDWCSGDRGLAAIRLAFARLPRLNDQRDAYRIFLAETALDAGCSPRRIVEELSYESCAALFKFDPNQPRVPSGSGAESGRWTSDGTGRTVATSSTSNSGRIPGLVPVFEPSEPDEADVPSIQETERRFGLPDADAERSGRRLLLPDIPFAPSSPPSSARAPARPPSTVPAPSTSPVPGPKPAPFSGGFGGADPTQSNGDKGPACPAPQNDRPNGLNVSGDEFEYSMSLLINPNNPTPKNSAATPNVTSQAYYLPSPSPDGKTSFDDCKKDGTRTVLHIPNLKPGDMFEMKASGWSGLLSNRNTKGYQAFEAQVKNQTSAVQADGRGRQVYYCMTDQTTVDLAAEAFSKYANSHFLVCH